MKELEWAVLQLHLHSAPQGPSGGTWHTGTGGQSGWVLGATLHRKSSGALAPGEQGSPQHWGCPITTEMWHRGLWSVGTVGI